MLMKTKDKDFISTIEAANKAFVDPVTIINWCKYKGIGKKVGGRWRVDPKKLDEMLDGEGRV